MLRPLLWIIVAALSLAQPILAQMTPEQRLFEFQSLVALYARAYGPYNWKVDALGVDLFKVQGWADRVRQAKTDVEYFQICSEYVASLQDGHSRYVIPSNFYADMGLYTDIYDGKVLIEFIDRSRYPSSRYPVQIGDELVSLDGVPVADLIKTFEKTRGFGNPRAAARLAADALTYRPQQVVPTSVDLPDTVQAVVRRESGDLETYMLSWRKSGIPYRNVSRVPWIPFDLLPNSSRYQRSFTPQRAEDPLAFYYQLQIATISPLDRAMLDRTLVGESGEPTSRKAMTGWGELFPYYNPPSNFAIHTVSDAFLSGTYVAGGQRIGFIRLPDFSPASPAVAAREFEQEIIYFRANTDGLVIDATRNTGGYACLALDYAQRLIPQTFKFPGFQFRPSQTLINQMDTSLRNAIAMRADRWIIDTYQGLLNTLMDAAKGDRALTGPMPICTPFTGRRWAPTIDNFPATDADGNNIAYDKPLIVLVDELSASAGDLFPAVIQDAKRGLIVGMRTSGLGGTVLNTAVGPLSESVAYYTASLMVRNTDIQAPGFPLSRYVENVGVRPDVELDYMTKENLLTDGEPFVEKFTSIIVDEIRKSKGQ